MLLNGMFGGKKEWMPFNDWIKNLGLTQDISERQTGKTSAQNTAIESARIKAKFAPIADEILKQRAQGTV